MKTMLTRSALCFVVLLGFQLCVAPLAHAKEKKYMELNATFSFSDTLNQAKKANSPVKLWLVNGTQFKGRVASLGNNNVVLKNLVGREFFSAMIRLDQIASIEVRTRDK